MASLGERLRRERELRGISLKEISEETKIGVHFLEALEENRFERIPGEFYGRSYLRAYARCLGLDEEQALNDYSYSSPRRSEESNQHMDQGRERKPTTRMRWALGGAAALVLPAVLLLRSEPASQREEIRPTASSPLVVRPAPVDPRADAGEPLVADVPALESGLGGLDRPGTASLRVVLTVDDDCWLQIVADGDVVATGLKERGFRSEFTANDEVRLWLGNAGVVRLWLNDQPAKSLGRRNQVLKDLTITTSDYRRFVELS